MPLLPSKQRELDRQLQEARRLSASADFQDPTRWEPSKRGNLWRDWGTFRLTIFERKYDGLLGFCIAGPGGETDYSARGYETVESAIDALAEALEVGE